jgi:peptidoglycan/LPS O-acetylase OafA/YrhL
MSFGPVVLIGRISYGLYLWHFPVFTIVQGVYHSRHPGLWELLLEFALSFGVATLSFVLLESPLLRLKDRLRPLVAQPPAVTAVHEPA